MDLEPQLTRDPVFLGWVIGCLLPTSAAECAAYWSPLWVTPQPPLVFAWSSNQVALTGLRRGWPSFSSYPSYPLVVVGSLGVRVTHPCGIWDKRGNSHPCLELQFMVWLVCNMVGDSAGASHSHPTQISSTYWPRDSYLLAGVGGWFICCRLGWWACGMGRLTSVPLARLHILLLYWVLPNYVAKPVVDVHYATIKVDRTRVLLLALCPLALLFLLLEATIPSLWLVLGQALNNMLPYLVLTTNVWGGGFTLGWSPTSQF